MAVIAARMRDYSTLRAALFVAPVNLVRAAAAFARLGPSENWKRLPARLRDDVGADEGEAYVEALLRRPLGRLGSADER